MHVGLGTSQSNTEDELRSPPRLVTWRCALAAGLILAAALLLRPQKPAAQAQALVAAQALPADPRRTPLPDSLYPYPEQRAGVAAYWREPFDIPRLYTGFIKLQDSIPDAREQALGADFCTVLRVGAGYYLAPDPDSYWAWLADMVRAVPGHLWFLGNEQENPCRGDRNSREYAQIYHDLYVFIKSLDPTARVGIGGVVLPSLLRRSYLDKVLLAYEDIYGSAMPIDVWNIHNLLLSEGPGPCRGSSEKNPCPSWVHWSGAYVPRELWCANGKYYSNEDQAQRLDEFQRLIIEFRQWMKERGFQDKELIITEMGVLPKDLELTEGPMPKEWVQRFLFDSFEWMRTATDPSSGCPVDGYRLVQRWAWFSLDRSDDWNGALFDVETKEITEYGLEFANFNARFLPAAPTDIFFQKGWTGYTQDPDVWIGPLETRRAASTLAISADRQGKALLRFDLSLLPPQAQVLTATLTLRTAAAADTRPVTVSLYSVKRAWDYAGVSWTSATTGTLWQVAGCSGALDRDPAAVARQVLTASQAMYTWDVTAAARQWVANPAANYGLLMEGEGASGSQYTLYSSDQPENPPYSMHRYRPKLELWVQLPPLATPTPGPSPTPTQTPTQTTTPTPRRSLTPTQTSTAAPAVACFQQGVSPRPDYLGVSDTTMDGTGGASGSLGQSPDLRLRYDSMKKILLRWDLGELPAGIQVVGARLELYAAAGLYENRFTRVLAYELLRPWSENSATWSLAAEGQPWQIQGCGGVTDRSFNASASTNVLGPGQWQKWEGAALTELVQRWVCSPETNLGLILAPVWPSSEQEWTFRSSQFAQDPTQRPRLCVSYFSGDATPIPSLTASWTTSPTGSATVAPSGTITPGEPATGTPTPTPTPTSTPTRTRSATPSLTPRESPTPGGTPTSLPSVACFQQGVSPQAAYRGVADTYIDGNAGASARFGQSTQLHLSYDSMRKVLLRWDLQGQLPDDARVVSARMELYAASSAYENRFTRVLAYEVLRPWSEDGASWTLADEGQPWQIQGCRGDGDRSFTASASCNVQGAGQWQRWEGPALAELVQRWIDSPESNLGLILSPVWPSSEQAWAFFSSQYSADRTVRPKLCVSYFGNAPTPSLTPSPTASATLVPSATASGTAVPTATATPTATAELPHRTVYLPLIVR